MQSITIYSTMNCPYCVAAKNLCINKGLDYKEIDLTNDPDELARIKEQTGMLTVPQIFIGEEFIGGYTELRQLNDAGELDKKLLKD
ncbi:glutaredoxin domain-containing protein [Desulfitibacter alkalitolerans]|uniref:glutaredoxin domain-containing protein n=1 Tax=Desulfitibacter alkalitolerans TaxID=264641 RepID=UPI000482DF96|nr:glutaredoxin domain-containing protein [Desulfitibacter alkalitolerans]